jgi:signal transduction histidine kinase
MTFRTRLFLALGLATALPVAAMGLAARRILADQAGSDADRAAAEAEEVVTVVLGGERIRTGTALGALARRLADDDRMRFVAAGAPDARAWLESELDAAMRLNDLDLLHLLDADGILVAGSGQGTVVATAEPVTASTREYVLVGGRSVDPEAPAGQLPEGLAARLLRPGEPERAAEGWKTVGSVGVGLYDGATARRSDGAAAAAAGAAGAVGTGVMEGRIVITQDLAPYAGRQRSLDLGVALSLALAVPAALLVAAVLARSLARPLGELAGRAETMDLGREGQAFDIGRSDEVGTLAAALDRMNDRLVASAARLQSAERAAATGDLARQVNHDLKNGLAPIRHVLRHLKGVAHDDPGRLPQVFLEREPSLEESLAYLETLARSYGARRAPTGRADVNAAARAVAAEHAGRQVRLELAEPAPHARADDVSLRRILGNLVGNALDALDAAPRAAEGVTISTAPGGESVHCVVEDRGRGMSHDELARVFEAPFTTKPGGSGTGLAVVRRLVEELGGSIRVETAPGRGTRVELTLPAAGADVGDGA